MRLLSWMLLTSIMHFLHILLTSETCKHCRWNPWLVTCRESMGITWNLFVLPLSLVSTFPQRKLPKNNKFHLNLLQHYHSKLHSLLISNNVTRICPLFVSIIKRGHACINLPIFVLQVFLNSKAYAIFKSWREWNIQFDSSSVNVYVTCLFFIHSVTELIYKYPKEVPIFHYFEGKLFCIVSCANLSSIEQTCYVFTTYEQV